MREYTIFKFYKEPEKMLKHEVNLVEVVSGQEKVMGGSVRFVDEIGGMKHFNFHAKYWGRIVKEKAPIIEEDFDIWQHHDFLVVLDAPRQVAKVGAIYICEELYGILRGVENYYVDEYRFTDLTKYVQENNGSVRHTYIKHRDGVITASGNLENFPELGELIKRLAHKLKAVGYHIKRGDSFYSFRISDWGGGTIYSPPNLLPHEISGFIEIFRDVEEKRKVGEI